MVSISLSVVNSRAATVSPVGTRDPRLAVLASGTGSVLEALVAAALPICLVAVDRQCRAEQVAEAAGIRVERVARGSFGAGFDREAYTVDLVEALRRHDVDLVAMAGFGTILGRAIHEAYPDRLVNTHPSLLPAFKGWHAVEAALAAGVAETGCTVHLATLEVDEGPVLAQESVPVLPGDTPELLHERIKEVERRLYPAALRRMLDALKDEAGRTGATTAMTETTERTRT